MSVSDNDDKNVPAGGAPAPTFGTGSFLVGPVFLAFAAWIWFGPQWSDVPELHLAPIDKALISTEPRRKTVNVDPPVIHVNNFDRTCMECHRTIKNPVPKVEGMIQHTHIALNHGPNTTCYVCHDYEDRNMLVVQDAKVPFTKIVELCGNCHGSLVQDWKNGAHGRTNGYWDPKQGPMTRLICTQCHDPHNPRSPAMDSIVPLPGPNTLRMQSGHARESSHGDAEHAGEGHGKRDPLREALQRAIEHHNEKKGSAK